MTDSCVVTAAAPVGVAVTVTVYVPAVVVGVELVPVPEVPVPVVVVDAGVLLLPPPHPERETESNSSITKGARYLRRRPCIPMRSKLARAAPPPMREKTPAVVVVLDPVVAIVTMTGTAAVPVMVVELGTLHVGRLVAPAGPDTLHVRVTLPVKPFKGVYEICVVPDCPGVAMVTGALGACDEMVGVVAADTVTEVVAELPPT
jgi:hypothetical protein